MVTIKTIVPTSKPTNGSLASIATSMEAIPDFLKVANRTTTPLPAPGKLACAIPAETAPKTTVAAKAPSKAAKSATTVKAKKPTAAPGRAKAKDGTKTASKPKTAQAAPGKAARGIQANEDLLDKLPGVRRVESKTETVGRMLRSANGATTAEILAVTRWPSVSIPQMARANGVKLRKEKKPGELTRYFAIVVV